VGQTYSAPSSAGYPRKIHQKAKSSKSLQPHLNLLKLALNNNPEYPRVEIAAEGEGHGVRNPL